MGYLISAYALSLIGGFGYALWLTRARQKLRRRLEAASAARRSDGGPGTASNRASAEAG